MQDATGADASLKEGEGYDEIEAPKQVTAIDEEQMENDLNGRDFEELQKDHAKRDELMEEIFNISNLSESQLKQRQLRYERECEKGYFLQPIQV